MSPPLDEQKPGGIRLSPGSVLISIVVLLVATIAAVTLVVLAGDDNAPAYIATITGPVVAVIGSLLVLLRVEEVHTVVNSRTAKQDAALAEANQQIQDLRALLPSPRKAAAKKA